MRKAVQITGAAVVAAVLMTGCSKSSDDKKTDPAAKPSGAASSAPAADPAASQKPIGSGNVTAAELKGGWSKGKLSDQSLMVMSFAGNQVMLSTKTACSGKLVDNAQPATVEINHCQDGSTDYAKGTIKKFDGKSLTIAWASGKEDTLTKTVGGDGKPAINIPIPAKPGS
ncbi:hypothetical protein [Streptomyces sp. NPDC049555]|uniref:hypothetical protein n=1 Tax=unclassified Streptomyces TaxID=2593676 RepID=UPI0034309018